MDKNKFLGLPRVAENYSDPSTKKNITVGNIKKNDYTGSDFWTEEQKKLSMLNKKNAELRKHIKRQFDRYNDIIKRVGGYICGTQLSGSNRRPKMQPAVENSYHID